MRASGELGTDGERVGETGAGRGEVEAPGFSGAELVLNKTGGGGKHHVRGDGGEDDQVDFVGIGFGLGEKGFGGLDGEMRRGRALFDDVAFANAGARANPLIVGGYHFFQVGIGEDFGRNATCHTRNFRGDAMRHETPSRMTRSEEYGFYAIAERSYKECAQKRRAGSLVEGKENPGG